MAAVVGLTVHGPGISFPLHLKIKTTLEGRIQFIKKVVFSKGRSFKYTNILNLEILFSFLLLCTKTHAMILVVNVVLQTPFLHQ